MATVQVTAAPPGTAHFSRLLTLSGMKVTTARLQVLKLLSNGEGLDFHGVCRALAESAIALPPGTVHRVLCELSASGLLERDAPPGTPGVRFSRPVG